MGDRELVPAIAKQEEATDEIFLDKGCMMKLSILALACIPAAILTDKGIFDGRTQVFFEKFK